MTVLHVSVHHSDGFLYRTAPLAQLASTFPISPDFMTSYKRIQVVGKGSFGCCWLVRNQSGERCILKKIDVSTMSKQHRTEAATEVSVLKKLMHPYIISYRDSFLDGSLLCIIMDFAEQGDLYRVIERRKKSGTLLPETLVMRWFTQIVLALKHMHERHILHRDLKTQNIFLTGSGQGNVKLGDFGIARVLRNTSDCARTYIGTPYYCSPEICQEQPYSYKSDVWSLGCVLYEMATLRHAFDADSMRHLVIKILRSVPPQVPAVFSEDLRSLIAHMLTKDPRRRPSVHELVQDPLVRTAIHQLLLEIEKLKEPFEKSRCTSPAKSPVRSPAAKVAARPEVPTPPKGPKGLSQKERRPCPAQATKPGFARPRSASRESLRGRSPSPAKGKQIIVASGATIAKAAAREASPQTSPPDAAKAEVKHQQADSKSDVAGERKDLIRTLEEGLNCKDSAMKEGLAMEYGHSCSCFMNPEGGDIKLPVNQADSLAYRIEALRLYIEHQLGISEFLLVYKHLTSEKESEDDNAETDGILSSKARSFLTLVTQLIACEDKFYAS